MQFRSLIWLTAVAGLCVSQPAARAGAPDLASYRAVYDLSVDDTGDAAGSGMVSGRLVMEFVGSACGNTTSKTRIVTEGEDEDGNQQITDARSDMAEKADGHFEFSNQTYVGDQLSEDSAGVATRQSDGVVVVLDKPGKKRFLLDAAVAYPTEQLRRTLLAAAAGKHFLAMGVYDGTETGEVVYDTATVIGAVSSDPNDFGAETLIGQAGFAGLPHWAVTTSYFEKGAGTDDAPSYVSSYVVYANGIGRNLRIDYGKFALDGHLSHLDILPAAKC